MLKSVLATNSRQLALISVLLALVLVLPSVAAQCSLKYVRLNVQYKDCFPTRVLTTACQGTCNTYVRPSPSANGQLERFCQCCDAVEMRQNRIIVRCPNPDDPATLRRYRLRLNAPLQCVCRPCSTIPSDLVGAEGTLFDKRDQKDT
ncbi:hypothetical protein ACJMK2_009317 [Sinanodonta woodiana]|uniref:Bursicon n=1 Tax=Sinanodonta woodiana TaxID=1069815 RepID=A0ABD3VBX6_SINWO